MNINQVIKYLNEKNGATVYEVMKRFKSSRTAVLHHLRLLEKDKLISKYKNGRTYVYYVLSNEVISNYFDKKIKELKADLESILNLNSRNIGDNGSRKLNLCFVNYLDLSEESFKRLQEYYEIADYSKTQLYLSPEEFVKRAGDADVIVNNYACSVDSELLKNLPNLRYMALATHMYKYLDLKAAKDRGVHVSNIPYDYKSTAVTEFVLSQTFTLLRPIEIASRQVKVGVNEFKNFKGEQLRGKKIVIFGTDSGTLDLVNNLKGIGVEVSIYTEDHNIDPSVYGVSHFANRDEIFKTADIFYFSWTGDEYKELVSSLDSSFFKLLVKPIYIISVFKHKNIDYKALRDAIYSGKVKGIAFDYFPEISNRLNKDIDLIMHLPNVHITPDIGWYTNRSVENLNKYLVERLVAYAKGNDKFLLV